MKLQIESTKTIYKKALHLSKLNKEYQLVKVNNTFSLKSEYFGN
jgi:hypothetical protein